MRVLYSRKGANNNSTHSHDVLSIVSLAKAHKEPWRYAFLKCAHYYCFLCWFIALMCCHQTPAFPFSFLKGKLGFVTCVFCFYLYSCFEHFFIPHGCCFTSLMDWINMKNNLPSFFSIHNLINLKNRETFLNFFEKIIYLMHFKDS